MTARCAKATPEVRVHKTRGLLIALYTDHAHAWCIGLAQDEFDLDEYRLINIPIDEYDSASLSGLPLSVAAEKILNADAERTNSVTLALAAMRDGAKL